MPEFDIAPLQPALSDLVQTLRALGYRFAAPDEVLPGPVAQAQIEAFEALVGPLPDLLRDFYLTIGSVNLIGEHPQWECDGFPDPLYVSDFDYLLSRAREYATDPETREWFDDCYGSFIVELAPDAYHKADVSGGECYHIPIPAEPDPVILGMLSGPLRFSAYLTQALDWGGFPGLAECEHNWPIRTLQRPISAAAGSRT